MMHLKKEPNKTISMAPESQVWIFGVKIPEVGFGMLRHVLVIQCPVVYFCCCDTTVWHVLFPLLSSVVRSVAWPSRNRVEGVFTVLHCKFKAHCSYNTVVYQNWLTMVIDGLIENLPDIYVLCNSYFFARYLIWVWFSYSKVYPPEHLNVYPPGRWHLGWSPFMELKNLRWISLLPVCGIHARKHGTWSAGQREKVYMCIYILFFIYIFMHIQTNIYIFIYIYILYFVYVISRQKLLL